MDTGLSSFGTLHLYKPRESFTIHLFIHFYLFGILQLEYKRGTFFSEVYPLEN